MMITGKIFSILPYDQNRERVEVRALWTRPETLARATALGLDLSLRDQGF